MFNHQFSPSVLLYHIYIVNNWKATSENLLKDVPHDDIYINVNIDLLYIWKLPYVIFCFKQFDKVRKITFTLNSKTQAEVRGFKRLRSAVLNKGYALATYIHGKGVTKPRNKNIQDWVELMRYFIMERMDLCLDAFSKGSKLYGVNIGEYNAGEEKYGPYRHSSFHFSGNFVTVNLKMLNVEFFQTPLDEDYFGVEGFWGKLCTSTEAYCPHISGKNITNHYREPYPASLYKTK